MPEPVENLDDQDVDDQIVDDKPVDDTDQPSETEKKAIALGWLPKDDWEGNEDNWNSAPNYLRMKEIIDDNKSVRSNMDRMEHNFNERIENNNKLNQQMLDLKVSELKSKRDNAASEADMDAYNDANKQLDNLVPIEQQPVSPQNIVSGIVEHPVTQAFIAENEWIKEQTPKGIYGQRIFTNWIAANQGNPHAILEDGLKLVKESVNQAFPSTNPNRSNVQQMGDRGNGPKKSASRNRLTMEDLNAQERAIYSGLGGGWKNEEDFLQAVADSRKGE